MVRVTTNPKGASLPWRAAVCDDGQKCYRPRTIGTLGLSDCRCNHTLWKLRPSAAWDGFKWPWLRFHFLTQGCNQVFFSHIPASTPRSRPALSSQNPPPQLGRVLRAPRLSRWRLHALELLDGLRSPQQPALALRSDQGGACQTVSESQTGPSTPRNDHETIWGHLIVLRTYGSWLVLRIH